MYIVIFQPLLRHTRTLLFAICERFAFLLNHDGVSGSAYVMILPDIHISDWQGIKAQSRGNKKAARRMVHFDFISSSRHAEDHVVASAAQTVSTE